MNYVTIKDYWLPCIINDDIFWVKIPKGFVSDGDSYVSDVCLTSSIFHDWIYKIHRQCIGEAVEALDANMDVVYIHIDRNDCDRIYAQLQHNIVRGTIRYIGLKIFGWLFYKRKEPTILTNIVIDESKIRKCRHDISGLVLVDNGFKLECFSYMEL